jgi:hypothetical protein
LLALGFAGAFRRSELVALTVADLVDAPDGLRVMIRRSKTDQEGEGQARGSGITEGPVFRPVLKGSRLQAVPITAHSARRRS